MNEQEWLEYSSPDRMLEFVRHKVSDRKLRLFNCACCRAVRHLMPDPQCWEVVLVAERFADEQANVQELVDAEEMAYVIFDKTSSHIRGLAAGAAHEAAGSSDQLRRLSGGSWANAALALEGEGVEREARQSAPEDVDEILAAWAEVWSESGRPGDWTIAQPGTPLIPFFRCCFGNPFRPMTLDPAWLTFDVRMIAAGAYEDRAFNRLPILADALQDAGCENEDILSHLRSDGPHVRGCWVLDLILGKS